ncbi:MAG: DUF4115 domain-containing protein [Sneathiellales bacterium]|nr:DUF4115 domain-containing protein [Sneathiellales bacterium]
MAKKKNLPLEDVSQKRLNLSVPGEKKASQLPFPAESEPKKEELQKTASAKTTLLEETDDGTMSSVGDQLRVAREKKGLSAHEMAEQLRLRPSQILALEKGAYDELPGQAFVTGFLRSYANALELDAVNIVRLYRLEHDGKLGAPELAFPEPTSEGKMPGGTLIISTCLVALLAFGGWYYYQLESKTEFEAVSEAPERLTAKIQEEKPQEEITEQTEALTTDTSGSAAENTDRDTAPEMVAELTKKPDTVAPSPTVTSDVAPETSNSSAPVAQPSDQPPLETSGNAPSDEGAKKVADTATEAAAGQGAETKTESPSGTASVLTSEAQSNDEVVEDPEPSAETNTENPQQDDKSSSQTASLSARQYPQTRLPETTALNAEPESRVSETLGIENKNARVILVAQQEAWVQILDDQGTTLFDGVMEIGDTYLVPNQNGVILNAANAAAMEIRLDGSILQSLGAFGEIIEGFSLDPENLKSTLSPGQ